MKKIITFVVFLLGIFPIVVNAQGMSGRDIVGMSYFLYKKAVFESENIRLEVTANGKTVEKAFWRYISFDPYDNHLVAVRFYEGKRDAGLSILIKYQGLETMQSLRMPSEKKIRRVSIGNGKYIAGTDLTHEDAEQLIREATDRSDYSVIAQDGNWQIEAKPKDAADSEYSKRIMHIGADYTIGKIEYFVFSKREGKDVLAKVQENRKIFRESNGLWRVDECLIKNLQMERETLITVLERNFSDKADGRAFSENYLLGEEEKL